MIVDTGRILNALESYGGFVHPNWEVLKNWVTANVDEADRSAAWASIQRCWVYRLRNTLPPGYEIHDRGEFLLLTGSGPAAAATILHYGTIALKSIRDALPGIAAPDRIGKLVILHFPDTETFRRYLSDRDGKPRVSDRAVGCCVGTGYPHVAMTAEHGALHVLRHELAHACLSRLGWPRWLNEGAAQRVERLFGKDARPPIASLKKQLDVEFWKKSGLAGFWNGTSFGADEKETRQSYLLGELLLDVILVEFTRGVTEFLANASAADAGASSAVALLGHDLGFIAAKLLGPGEWNPT